MTVSAVLFDIDGTLVDSNYLHVDAWAEGFRQAGVTVPSWRIHRMIGADSSQLLEELAGDQPEEVQQRAKAINTETYQQLIPKLRVLPGAREIVAELTSRGIRVVLATSAPEEELGALLEVLDLDESQIEVTGAQDVETAKPEPDIIAVALERGGVDASEAIMVGDAIWDAIAAKRAGVRTIGVLSGGTGPDELREAGAIAVYNDVSHLLDHLDEVLAH
ncbi:MAG TPA: HAD family hydrolase [Rhodoglobus sp.]|nr:HAD family hydrolase [Rhodoglobus sp.]